ncbi:BapA/Bap/LapF family large adhesin [Thiopseudomonas alkaliphila]|uniref:BapA/Bap/LapF family large adhesin n=1 Tax=Thiopseudomonas alkaliphila TaxID=1697053 RepID=UPI0025777274|nr:BapA/Bap/LapF family large adhesin [Thiopseudomonas alkaliphila]
MSDKETITGDTTADAPVVEDVINGFDDNGDITDTTIRGEAEAGSTVEVTDPVTGKVVGSGTADGDGKFKVVVEGGLEDAKDYEVTAKDPAGNVSDKETITGDTTADAPTAQLAEDTGSSAEDGITNNGQVVVSGLEPNATWEYSTDGGKNWIAGTGDSFTLNEGHYLEGDIQVRQTDAAGNTSASTQLGEITVDTQPPSIENLESYNVDTKSPANGEADKTVVTFKGEPGVTYTVTIGNTTKRSSGDDEGNHEVTFLPPEAMGTEVIIIGTDTAGNTISATAAVADELRFDDTSAPDDSSTSVTVDPITADNVLNKAESETQVTVSGTVKGVFTAGDTITITLGGNVIGTGNVDADGRFSVTVEGADLVAAEQVKVTVEASSAAGVKGEITSEHSYTVDVDAPEVSQVATITLDKSPANGDADITIVSFRGDDAEATYTVVIGNTTVIATGPDADGFYVAEFPPQAADQEVVITATDKAGNSTTTTDITPTEITSGDTEVPQQPEITSVTNSFDEQGELVGTVIKGKTDGGALVQLYDAQGTLISQVEANINGNFEFAGTVLENGENYTVSAKYELGNSSPAVTVVGDTEAPKVDTVNIVQLDTSDPADGAANQTLLTFNTDEPEAKFTFSYVDKDGKVKEYDGEVVYSAQGNTVSAAFVPPLDAGDKIIIIGTDSYGNSGEFTPTEVVPDEVTAVADNTPPKLTDVSLEEVTGGNGELTKHTFSFTTNDPNASYKVTVNGVPYEGEPDIDNGTYTYTFEPPLKAGDKVNVEATDTAGNTSSASATAEIFLNIIDVEQVDTDSRADGEADKTIVKFVANNKEPQTFSVKDANGKKIDVTVTRLKKSAGEDEETAPWQYEVTFEPALAAGAKVIIVGKLEGLEDVSKEATTPDGITRFEDTVAPDAPVVDGFTNNDDNSTTVTGTAEAGSTVKITDPVTGKEVGSGTADGDGNFKVVVEGGLEDAKAYEVTATDKANNTSEPPAIVIGDTTAPEKLADDAIKIGNNGDDFINAAEINDGKVKVVIELPKDAEDKVLTEVGDILVVNGVDYVITEDHVTAGKVEFEFDAPKEGEQLTVDALLKDKHNNASEPVNKDATVDTEAPTKPIIDLVVVEDEKVTKVEGRTEPNAIIKDTAGNQLTTAGEDGKFTIDPAPEGWNGNLIAEDAAGNQSEPVNVLKLPGIEWGFDNVASVDEGGNVTEHTDDAHDKFSNNGFTNDATPYFEIPAGQAADANKNVLIITDADGNQTVVNAQVKDLGDGNTYLEITDKLVDGKYQVQYTTDADAKPAEGADPQVLPSQGNELSESLTFTVDTQSPAAPTIEKVQNTFDADGKLTGTTISGKVQDKEGAAEAGATVKVKDAEGNVVSTAVTDKDGNFTINVEPALENGQKYTVEATDKAGNTSKVSDSIIGDTTAPTALAPDAITMGDDANTAYINAKEVTTEGKFNVTVTLPAGIEVDDILVINGEEIKVTQAHLDAKKVEHQLSTDDYAEGETITVEAVIKDAFGNSSAGISANAVLDTQAPEVEFKQVNPTEFTLKVSEAGTVVLKDQGDNVLKTIEVTADDAGTDLTVTFDEEFAPNTQIKILATDKAGNVTDTQISVENIRTEASDNTEELVLDIVATQREATEAESIAGQKVTGFGVVSAGLGGVADAGVLDFANKAIELNVAEGTERKLELFVEGGGVSIGDTYDLIIFKEDAYGNTKFYDVYDSWFTVPFLGMTKNGEITITEPGKYHIMLSAKAGVKVIGGATLKVTKDTVVDYNNYESVSGVKKGNVITDLDVSGKDQVDAPDDTRITKITYKDDKGTHEVDVPAVGSTVIELTHGTLTVSAKGNYTYKLNEGANPEFGEKEEITYTLTNSKTGDSSDAKLTINLVDKPSNLVPDSTVWLDMKPEAKEIDIPAKDQLSSKSWANILGVGLGIADIGLIAIENGLEIKVGENQVRDVTFWADGGAPVALGYSPVDLMIYKKETTANGDFWQLYTIEENWFGIVGAVVGAGRTSKDKTFRFDEGEYKAVLVATTGGLSVIPTATLHIRKDKLYEYEQTNAKVETDLGLDEGAVVYSVNGDPLGEGDNIIQGQYGTLTIKADGSYSYKLYQNIAYKDIGNMETFSYSILGADNKLYNSTLNIVINNVQANDDFGDARFGLDNQEAYEGWAESGTKRGSNNSTYSSDLIEVKENQVYDLTLEYDLNPTASRVDEFVIRVIDVATGKVVKVYNPDVKGEKGELSWSLTEGQYRVEVIIDPNLAYTVKYDLNLQGTITTLDEFQAEQTNTIVEEGSLLDNDTYKEGSGIAELAHIEVNGKPLDIVVDGKFDNNLYKSITIEGEHGTLVVQQDGSYTYTAHGNSYGVDVFDYKLISIAGSSDSAELTFNVGMNATGSKYDDKISSTAGNDTFEGGFGSDIFNFDLLDIDDATGGNGVDTWTDFHFGEVGTDADADVIDISALLPEGSENIDLDGLKDFLQVEFNEEEESITVSIDRDGKGSRFEFEELLVLTNQKEEKSLDDLFNNDQIIY